MAGIDEHSCIRGEDIGDIKASIRFFQNMEERREQRELERDQRLEERETRMVTAMETIAKQGSAHSEALKAHGQTLLDHKKAIDELFNRMTRLANPPATLKTKFLKSPTFKAIALMIAGAIAANIGKDPEIAIKIVRAAFGG